MTLEARRLSCGFRTATVEGLNWTARPGERWAVVGPNGAGKTTLLRTLAGLLPPLAGEIWLGEEPLTGLGAVERARRVAYMAQEEPVAFPFPVERSVALGRHAATGTFRDGPGDADRVRAAMAATDVVHLAGRPLDRLSGGERARSRLARVVAQDAPVWILDEPTGSLDPRHALAAARLLAARPGLVVAAVHDLALAARFATHVLVVAEGRASGGPAGEILRSNALERAFGVGYDRFERADGTVLVSAR